MALSFFQYFSLSFFLSLPLSLYISLTFSQYLSLGFSLSLSKSLFFPLLLLIYGRFFRQTNSESKIVIVKSNILNSYRNLFFYYFFGPLQLAKILLVSQKCDITFGALSKCSIFQYCNSNIGLFSITPHLVTAFKNLQ